jgi:surface antigen
MIDVPTFIRIFLGARGTGTTVGNTGECVGLVEKWLQHNGKPSIPGNAKDLIANADPKAFKVTANLPSNYPPPGAVVCWDSSWGAGYGHTAIVVASNVNQLAVFEQNDPLGAAPLVATHSYAGVSGWLTW